MEAIPMKINTVVHTKTHEQFIELLEILEKKGYKWASGMLPTANNALWVSYKSKTAVWIDMECGISYSSTDYFKKHSKYTVITFDDYLQSLQPNLNKKVMQAIMNIRQDQ